MKYYFCCFTAGENELQPELHRAHLEEQTMKLPNGESQFKQDEISSFTSVI